MVGTGVVGVVVVKADTVVATFDLLIIVVKGMVVMGGVVAFDNVGGGGIGTTVVEGAAIRVIG